MRIACWIISFSNLAAALAYGVKFLFVPPTLPTAYYGIVAWMLSIGFAILANLQEKR